MLNKTALDQGFIEKCAEYGITDPATISKMMQIAAADINKEASLEKTASANDVMQKRANLNNSKTLLDAGFVARCHDHGITDPAQINGYAKVAAYLVQQEVGNG